MSQQDIGGTTLRKPTNVGLEIAQFVAGMSFQKSPIPTLLLDSKGRVCCSNDAADEAFAGLNGDAFGLVLGIAVRCVHAAGDLDSCRSSSSCENCSLRHLVMQTIETGRSHRQVEVKASMRRGRKQCDCYLLLSTAVSDSRHGRRVLVYIEDITARKQAELNLRTALRDVQRMKVQLQQENISLREEIKGTHCFEEIVGKSKELKLTLQKTEHVAATGASVLILGETGTGKELIARAIHNGSPRKDRPMITINCAAIPSNLMESELFGHVAGAFTGALADKIGRFELAHRGTLFLDEIGELPLELQAKLLRVLGDGRFERIGSSVTQTVDVRIIAATNRDVREGIANGTFRSDLYYRLAVFPIEVPPLRARRQDIPLLTWHFVVKKQAQLGRTITSIPQATLDALTQYDWPGNIRELENTIERAVILSPGSVLQLDAHCIAPLKRRKTVSSSRDIASVERSHIVQVLEECGWKIKGDGNAADRLGLKPSTLRSRMKKACIERPQ